MVIVGKLSMRYRICSQDGIISTEDLKVSFDFLVDSFSFSIRLGVVGGREGEVVVMESS